MAGYHAPTRLFLPNTLPPRRGFLPCNPHIIIVISTQNTRELWGYTEGLSVMRINKKKVTQWLKTFPGALNDTGDVPVIKHGDGYFA
ncbi:hypothetical protein UL18_22870 [Salmonella enterica subsp. enterica serovar Newport]|nr:hypothetical protein [Salmonella enterica subsp. enterica serovar Newport]